MTHFPITHINDVLPHIERRNDFIVVDKGDYTVIDYVYAGPDTFDHSARLECRGLKFYPDGSLAARPLHKFRNVGETPELQPHLLDFSQPHSIMEKLDGSMIHACRLRTDVVFMTRMGRTDVALAAEDRHLSANLAGYCMEAMENDCTPIFEWTAPENRIVVRYAESALTLLAIRRNKSGEYLSRAQCQSWARDAGVPIVQQYPSMHAIAVDFLTYARAIQAAEGFVVRFDGGLWIKAKGDDYVLKHRAKDSITQEKNFLALVLNGGLDDVLPLLDEPDALEAAEYAVKVQMGIDATAERLVSVVADNANLTQKDFALNVVPTLDPVLRPLAFQIRAGQPAGAVVRARIAANTNSQSQVDAHRVLHGARWNAA